ncbi:MAG: ATP-binding cassette domain-containing protein, partial [Nitratireductor sp.]
MSMGRKGEPIIEVEGLDTRFGDNVIHENLDLTVKRGEVIGIVGGSGTGKSVLLRTILGLKRPDAGRVRVFGIDFSKLSEEERRLNEQRWGVLFQDGALFSALTVAENIQVPYREHLDLSPELMD